MTNKTGLPRRYNQAFTTIASLKTTHHRTFDRIPIEHHKVIEVMLTEAYLEGCRAEADYILNKLSKSFR